MPAVTFTLASLPSSTAKRLRFAPRDAPWVNTSGAVVTPDGFESSYPRGAAQSITLDTGPWRVRIGLSWYPFDVPAAGGDLAELIVWSIPAGAPATTIAAAVAEFLTANPVTAEVSDEAVAALAADDDSATAAQIATKITDRLADSGFVTQTAADANYAPATGIAKTALASAVQTSLGKADSAVQADVLDSTVSAKVGGIKTAPRIHDVDYVMTSAPTVTVETSATLTTGAWYRPRVGGGGAGSAVDTSAPFLYLGVGHDDPATHIAAHPTNSYPWYNSVVSTHKTVTNTNNPTQTQKRKTKKQIKPC